jgi:mono/diheme cytochrome c family protein
VALAIVAGACRSDMQDQPKYKPFRQSRFFDDGRAVRPPVEDTVARGTLEDTSPFDTGKAHGQYVRESPIPSTPAVLARGRERYEAFCSPCHDRTGAGGGMIVERGFRRPPSFHDDRLRDAADGYFVEVIAKGFGVMPAYAAQVPPDDRWAIVAYVRALQLSQHAPARELPAEDRARLGGGR